MVIIGVTGSMGTGKTTVTKMFASLGSRIIDADEIAHSLMKPGTEVSRKLLATFGKGIFNKNGTVNRGKLAVTVFGSKPDRLKQLNSIVHPVVINTIVARIKNARKNGTDAVVIDAPLLIEAGLEAIVDKLIVVTSKREIQEERSRMQHEFSLEEIRARISSQLPLSEKEKRANYIVDNNGSLEDTWQQVKEIWGEIG